MVDLFKRALLAGAVSLALAGPSFASADKPVIGVVVKIGGIPWFNAMEAGIKKKAAELGVKAFMIGPTSADPALQVRAIEDLIAKKVNVIGVVPERRKGCSSPCSKSAPAQAGIKVVDARRRRVSRTMPTGTSSSSRPKVSVKAYGKSCSCEDDGRQRANMRSIVGSLTVPLHNAWADAAIAYT